MTTGVTREETTVVFYHQRLALVTMNPLPENHSLAGRMVIAGIDRVISPSLDHCCCRGIRLLERLAMLDVAEVPATRQDCNQHMLPKAVSLSIYHKGWGFSTAIDS